MKKDISGVKRLLRKMFREEKVFKEKMKQQSKLNVDVEQLN